MGRRPCRNAHSSYSFPSITYLSLPIHSAGAYSPANTGSQMFLSRMTESPEYETLPDYAAVPGRSMERGADDLTCPAAIALIGINLDALDFLLVILVIF